MIPSRPDLGTLFALFVDIADCYSVRLTYPSAELTLSYKMSVFRAGKRRLFLAAWAHGISLYGWQTDRDGGFSARHPGLVSGSATIRLRPEDAAAIPDEEFTALAQAALKP